jgi:23S rRNA (adenine2030-N6)-methyltransferase
LAANLNAADASHATMNYRHAFHAGNFADVFKHAVLVRILLHLCAKPAAFRVIDTHAGAGMYDLAGPEAGRSPEWRDGIERLVNAPLSEPVRPLLSPYLDVVAAANKSGRLVHYPGSPALVRAFLRSQDRLIACEKEPNAAAALTRFLGHDRRCKAIAIDGWTALNAYVPPKERRGLVLVDPPFEEVSEFSHLAQALEAAHRKWPTGIYVAWYPIKERREPDALARRLERSGIANVLRAEVTVTTSRDPGRLGACGLILTNPPWTLSNDLAVLLPELARVLSDTGRGATRVDWLTGES